MIFHDRITVQMAVPFDPPQFDAYGMQIFDDTAQVVPAEVFPLDTDIFMDAGAEFVTSRYRMILAPHVDIPPMIGDRLRLAWGPFTFDVGPLGGPYVEGTVERHMLRGRLHHYELITKAVA